MPATGRAFDRITLGALILSLGLLVDDAIIAIEMMVVKMQEGMAREDAAGFAWTVTAAPMLAGTLVTIIGLMPVGFAQSSAGEYAGNIFWMVAFALLASWVVAVVFTPYLGRQVPAEHQADRSADTTRIYDTGNYRRLRRPDNLVRRLGGGLVALCVVGAFVLAAASSGLIRKEFFPVSDRGEVLVEIYRTARHRTSPRPGARVETVEAWLKRRRSRVVVTSYVGAGRAAVLPVRSTLSCPILPSPRSW